MRRRGLPARVLRGARLQRRRAWAEGLQRRRAPVQAAVRRCDAAARRATRATCRRAISKRASRCRQGVLRVINIYLPNGNPVGTEKFAYKLAWMSRLRRARQDAARERGADDRRRRLQRHPRRRRRLQPRSLGRRCAVPPETPAHFRALAQSRPDRRVSRVSRRAASLHVLGLSGRRLAEEPRASASTICCCRRRRRTGS